METGENSNAVSESGNPIQFRIFLASPGDVPLERKLVREAITHISNERRFRGRFQIEIIAWDQPGATVAMEAGLTPQQAIAQGLTQPKDCDLTVVVLWSRIGTQLPPDFERKEDGTPYLSGTEWEYLNALKGYQTNGKPAVWIYRREGAPQFPLDDPELMEKQDQWEKLENFFKVFTNPDGSLAGGINHYTSPDDLQKQFEGHLRDRLDKLLESLPKTPQSIAEAQSKSPSWTGSPYPGLEAFTPEQGPIFFGRGPEVDQLLSQFAEASIRFVAVVGVSGSGKSSLVKAGLLPRLRSGVIGSAPWTDLVFTPGERGDNPYLALAYAVKERLNLPGVAEKELARLLLADQSVAFKKIGELLEASDQAAEMLLVIDQFEELFTQCSEKNRNDFLALLEKLVALPRLRVIVTMRADFYARAIEEPVLARLLRRDRGTFPLDPPGISALLQMIIRPAEAAGLELQEGLAQCLLKDAGEGPGSMALIAFTLNQLFMQLQGSRFLGIEAYEAFGGVQGAVQQRAENALKGLPVEVETALPTLFTHLVEVNEQEVATRRRAGKFLLQEDAGIAAEALTESSLLVSGKGEDEQPTLEVAHETVLTGWDRLSRWIREHAESLRIRRDLESVALEWDQSGRHGGALRTGKLLQRYLGAAEPRSAAANDYLKACKRRRTAFRFGYGAAVVMVLASLGVFFHVSKSHYPPVLAAKGLFVQLGLWPVPEPRMETIPAGKFHMGDLSGDGDSDEQPVRPVRFAKAFKMGKYEVTFAEYDLFAAATGRDKPSDEGWGRDDRPVINIGWIDAVAYTRWLSKRTGDHYRLPSESEWEYAARAKTSSLRYWSDEKEAACEYANVFDAKNESELEKRFGNISWGSFQCEDDFPFTAPVGEFTANPWGLHDMLGNVWEWNQDCYVDNYKGAPKDGSPREIEGEGICSHRVLRGGSWYFEPRFVRSANRFRYAPDNRYLIIGCRLARTL